MDCCWGLDGVCSPYRARTRVSMRAGGLRRLVKTQQVIYTPADRNCVVRSPCCRLILVSSLSSQATYWLVCGGGDSI